MTPIINVKNLCFGYGSDDILYGVTFSITPGDYVALSGPNGAGKSTLIKVLLGLAGPYRGKIELFGQNRKLFNDWGRIGYLPQQSNNYNPLFPATAREVVRMGLLAGKSFPKIFNAADNERVSVVMKLMGIEKQKNKMVGELSGGQQQKVFLARALASNPSLLVLDEPSSALDPLSRDSFFALLEELNQEHQTTVIMVTHDTPQIGRYAKTLLYLDKKVVFYGGFNDFCQSPDMGGYFGSYSQHLICHQHD
ncbi:MAG: metal ABC transporter ATP-binding protein [Candidatus Falkowbacteria bacterium]